MSILPKPGPLAVLPAPKKIKDILLSYFLQKTITAKIILKNCYKNILIILTVL